MTVISSRCIHVTMTERKPEITLTWFNQEAERGSQFVWKPIEYLSNEGLEKVRHFLSEADVKCRVATLQEGRISVLYDIPKYLEGLFDLAAISDNPVEVLTTPFDVVLRAAIEVGAQSQDSAPSTITQ